MHELLDTCLCYRVGVKILASDIVGVQAASVV